MVNYDKVKLQRLINDEHGTNYHRNVPLDGYTVTLGDAFISFGFREVNGFTIAIIHYIYVTKKEDMVSLFSYCVNMWAGYGVKMIYYREHKRKSNIVKTFSHIGFDVHNTKVKNWPHNWISTNGFDESDCIEAFTPVAEEITKKTRKSRTAKK